MISAWWVSFSIIYPHLSFLEIGNPSGQAQQIDRSSQNSIWSTSNTCYSKHCYPTVEENVTRVGISARESVTFFLQSPIEWCIDDCVSLHQLQMAYRPVLLVQSTCTPGGWRVHHIDDKTIRLLRNFRNVLYTLLFPKSLFCNPILRLLIKVRTETFYQSQLPTLFII